MFRVDTSACTSTSLAEDPTRQHFIQLLKLNIYYFRLQLVITNYYYNKATRDAVPLQAQELDNFALSTLSAATKGSQELYRLGLIGRTKFRIHVAARS